MSFDAIQWALAQDVGKSPAKFVLVAMASFVNAESREWVCWPSYASIAHITHQDAKTVEAAVYKLKEQRFIVDTGQRKGETRKVIVYRLNDPKSGPVTQGPQVSNPGKGEKPNDPKTGGVRASGNPPEFPFNPPEFPPESPQISGVTTPKTGVGISNGTSKGTRKKKEDGASAPAILGVPDALLADYLQVRKAKKAGALTQTVIKALERESAKAGVSVAEAVQFCCEAGWQGFNAGWYLDRQAKGRAPKGAAARSFNEIDYTEGVTDGIPDA